MFLYFSLTVVVVLSFKVYPFIFKTRFQSFLQLLLFLPERCTFYFYFDLTTTTKTVIAFKQKDAQRNADEVIATQG